VAENWFWRDFTSGIQKEFPDSVGDTDEISIQINLHLGKFNKDCASIVHFYIGVFMGQFIILFREVFRCHYT